MMRNKYLRTLLLGLPVNAVFFTYDLLHGSPRSNNIPKSLNISGFYRLNMAVDETENKSVIVTLDNLIVTVKKLILDADGSPILKREDKGGNVWTYTQNRIIGVDPINPGESQTLFSASENPIIHKDHKRGDNYYEKTIDGVVTPLIYVAKDIKPQTGGGAYSQ